jgi:hypothetical protein
MYYAKFNKQFNEFVVSEKFIPNATKGTTKRKLFSQIRNNFAYIACMRKFGKVNFVYADYLANGSVKNINSFITISGIIIKTGHVVTFADRSWEVTSYRTNLANGFTGSALLERWTYSTLAVRLRAASSIRIIPTR